MHPTIVFVQVDLRGIPTPSVRDLCGNSSTQVSSLAKTACGNIHRVDNIVSSCVLDSNLEDAIFELRKVRARIPDKDPRLSALDSLLIPLMEIEMIDLISPYDGDSDDTLITDITADDLADAVSKALGQSYLQEVETAEVWPATGVMLGRKARCMVSLPVSAKGRTVAVHFLFDTSSPMTYLSSDALSALALEEWELAEKPIRVNGVRVRDVLCASDERIRSINILGQNVVDRANARVMLDYTASRWVMER